MYKYFKVIGKLEGETEVLFGSYDRNQSVYELESEFASWKDEGYKGLKVVSEMTAVAPDPEVYPDLNWN